MKMKLFSAIPLALSGCLTMSGTYDVSVVDANGNPVNGIQFTAHGSGIYTFRNAMCAAYPKGVVTIKDIKTGEELKSESPFRC